MTVRNLFGRGRPGSKRGPFAIKEDPEKGSPLVLAGGLAAAVALALTGTLTWLVMSNPAASENELVIARTIEKPAAPAVTEPAAVAEVAAAPSQPAAATAPRAVTPPVVRGNPVSTGNAAAPSIPVRANAFAPEVTAAIAPAVEALREVAVSDPDNPNPLASAPAMAAPTPSPRPPMQAEDKADTRPQPAAAPSEPKIARAAGSMRPAIARKAVNMRASGRSGAKVVMVIPAKAQIEAEPSCSHWCLVSYNGRQGYIYKDFVAAR